MTNLETEVVDDDIVDETEADTTESDDTTEDSPEADSEEVEGDAESDEDESDEDDDGKEVDEVEYEGKTYKVPRELKDALLRQADYTRKTQEVAELRKTFEGLTRQAEELSEAETTARDNIASINATLRQYSDIDWQTWRQQNPVAAMQAQMDYQALNQQLQAAQTDLQRASGERVALSNSQREERLREGHKQLAERIPDWGETKQRQLVETGRNVYGFTDEELNEIDDPRMILVLNDAARFAATQKQHRAKTQAAKQEAVKPAAKVKGGGSNPRKALDDRADINAWMEARNKTVRG